MDAYPFFNTVIRKVNNSEDPSVVANYKEKLSQWSNLKQKNKEKQKQ